MRTNYSTKKLAIPKLFAIPCTRGECFGGKYRRNRVSAITRFLIRKARDSQIPFRIIGLATNIPIAAPNCAKSARSSARVFRMRMF
jgi:hypothetical protein